MTDVFGEFVRTEWINRILGVVGEKYWNTYQLLTKRPGRMADYFAHRPRYEQIWAGTSIESRRELWRLEDSRRTNVGMRFLSLEPLFEGLGEARPQTDRLGDRWSARAAPMRARCSSIGCAISAISALPRTCRSSSNGNAVYGRKVPLPVLDGRVWREFPS
jgi:hypothetical protein